MFGNAKRLIEEITEELKEKAEVLPRLRKFVDDHQKMWDALTIMERVDIIESARSNHITNSDLEALIRRHVCLLISVYEGKPDVFCGAILASYPPDIASILMVETFRIMDVLSGPGSLTHSLVHAIRTEYGA